MSDNTSQEGYTIKIEAIKEFRFLCYELSTKDFNKEFLSFGQNFKFGPHVQYLSPAPLYHAAPMAYNMVTTMFGGTSLILDKFDAIK